MFSGFEARNGFDTRHPENWDMRKRRRVEKYGYILHSLTSTQHFIARPRTKAQREALRVRTGQLSPNQKAFVIHDIPSARVRYIKGKRKKLLIDIVREVKGGEVFVRDFIFTELLGFQPLTWEKMVDAMRDMLPFLPDTIPGSAAVEGASEEPWFVLLSQPHGPISAPVRKSMLLQRMQQWGSEYSNAFSGILIGVRLTGSRWDAAMAPNSEYNERQRRRLVYKQIQKEHLNAIRRKYYRSSSLTGKKGRVK